MRQKNKESIPKRKESDSDVNLLDDLEIRVETDVISNESDKENAGNNYATMQEKLFDILDNEDVQDVVDLNEKFLSQ